MCVRHIIKLDEDAHHRRHHDAPDRADDDDTTDKTTSKWRFGGKCDTGI